MRTMLDQAYGWCPPCRQRLFSSQELEQLTERARDWMVDLELLRQAGDRLDMARSIAPPGDLQRRPLCEKCQRRTRLADIRDGVATDRMCRHCYRGGVFA